MSQMYLRIGLPRNLRTEELLQLRHIPCLCRIGGQFEILFQKPLPEAQGIVQGWNLDQIEGRAPALAGGPYVYHAFGAISLKESAEDVYHIVDLAFFDESKGWCPIIVGGDLASPRSTSNDEYFDESLIPE